MTERTGASMRPHVAVENIRISQMPGIREGFSIDSFSRGINLIYGPNGIGKSRTAQALQTLIWPSKDLGPASLFGNLDVDGDKWFIEQEAGKTTFQNSDSSVPGFTFALPPETHRTRYLLTLQDLLRIDNKNFAQEIQREAAGGYDLEAVRSQMGIAPATKRYRPSRPDTSLRNIQTELRRLKQLDEQLANQESSLNKLKAEHKAAIAASIRLTELEAAKTYRDAKERLESVEADLSRFPDVVHEMVGDEFERAEASRNALAEKTEEVRSTRAEISHLEDVIGRTGLPREIPTDSVVQGLEQRLREIQRIEVELQAAKTDLQSHTSKLAELRSRLHTQLSESQMERLDAAGFRELAKLSRAWQQTQDKLNNLSLLENWLGPAGDSDRETLRRGLDLLSQHSRTVRSSTQTSTRNLVIISLVSAAILLVTAAVLLANALSQGFLLLAAAALPLLWVVLKLSSDSSSNELMQIQSQYSSLGLEQPDSWTPEEVILQSTKLQELIAKAELDHERIVRWGALETDRRGATVELQELRKSQSEYEADFGMELVETIPHSLTILADTLEDWRRERIFLSQANSRIAALEDSFSFGIEAVRLELRTLGVNTNIHDSISANAALSELKSRIAVANKASSDLTHARRRLDQTFAQVQSQEATLESVFNKLDLESDDLASLKHLCDQVEPYGRARAAVDAAKASAEFFLSRLNPDNGDALLDQHAIDNQILVATELASSRDAIQAEISRIETEVGRAKTQTQIEEVLANETDELDTLYDARRRDYSSAADQLVFELVQNRNREVNRPPVFRRAEQLFILFTNGAYSLGLDEQSSEFTAIDADTGRSLALVELSSGTRVQLLLAVRLAFIEASEFGLQLPLLLDETLGNTDDRRAQAILEAAITIANRGRQIMYFTAQQDEIAKWSAALKNAEQGPEWKTFDLATIRGVATQEPLEPIAWDNSIFTRFEIPDDADRYSVFEQLRVKPFNVQRDDVSDLDVWYVVKNPEDLVTLRNRGVRGWGQYLNLYENGYLRGTLSGTLHKEACARARVVEEFCMAWREGRPGRLTIDALRSSAAITTRFWDKVIERASANNWDGASLVHDLTRGKVSGFRRANIETLNEWLLEHGYISDTKPLDDATIRARVISALYDEINAQLIQVDDIDNLLDDVITPPYSGSTPQMKNVPIMT